MITTTKPRIRGSYDYTTKQQDLVNIVDDISTIAAESNAVLVDQMCCILFKNLNHSVLSVTQLKHNQRQANECIMTLLQSKLIMSEVKEGNVSFLVDDSRKGELKKIQARLDRLL